jgi:hypothetical protein
MTPPLSIHRSAIALLAAHIGLGLLPFVLLAVCHARIRWHGALPLGVCLVAALAASWIIAPNKRLLLNTGLAPLRRLLACLLLGASLAAIPWMQLSLPLAPMVIALGFSIRWWLFTLETLDLRRADRFHQPLPCVATRLRRVCTLIAGAVIPLLLVAGLPCIPLLWVSFVLTLFCQWTVSGETCHLLVHRCFDSSKRAFSMSRAHPPDGGYF